MDPGRTGPPPRSWATVLAHGLPVASAGLAPADLKNLFHPPSLPGNADSSLLCSAQKGTAPHARGFGTAQTTDSVAGVFAAAPLDRLPHRGARGVRRTLPSALGNSPFVLRQLPQESVLLSRLSPCR